MHDAVDLDAAQVAAALHERLLRFLAPLLGPLDRRIDRRLVRTLVGTVEAIVCFRNRPHGLLLSELGAYLLDPARWPRPTYVAPLPLSTARTCASRKLTTG
jgi:hypothetical protein